MEGISEDELEFHPTMGKLRSLLDVAHQMVKDDVKHERDMEAVQEEAGFVCMMEHVDMCIACCVLGKASEVAKSTAKAAAKERAKPAAKEAVKEEQRDGKNVSSGDKIKLEEAICQRFPGTLGLAGRGHTATGPKLLQALLKAKKEDSYELPPWEDRRVWCRLQL